jgi:NADH-quinone oxidoreductase subunit F
MVEVFERLENGRGRDGDVDLLADVSDNILGKSFCALGDAAAMPVLGAIKHFREEFDFHVREKRCQVNRRKQEIGRLEPQEVTA